MAHPLTYVCKNIQNTKKGLDVHDLGKGKNQTSKFLMRFANFFVELMKLEKRTGEFWRCELYFIILLLAEKVDTLVKSRLHFHNKYSFSIPHECNTFVQIQKFFKNDSQLSRIGREKLDSLFNSGYHLYVIIINRNKKQKRRRRNFLMLLGMTFYGRKHTFM